MPQADSVLERLRKTCLALPDTHKIFAGYNNEQGTRSIGLKLEMDHANAIIQIPGFSRAPYVGHKGWITIDPSLVKDWKTVQELIGESYRLIAPKRSLDKLPDGSRAAKGLV